MAGLRDITNLPAPEPGIVPGLGSPQLYDWLNRLYDAIRATVVAGPSSGDAFPEGGTAYDVLHGQPASPRWGPVDLASASVSGILPVGNGGTGLAAYAVGDIIYASAASTLARRSIGSAGDLLTVTAGVPQWASPASLGIANYWTRVGASGHLHPATTTDIVSIGATTAPSNSALLGLWGTLGLSHCNVTAAAGELISQWIPYASLNLLEAAIADNSSSRAAVRFGNETDNPLVFYFDGLGACAIGYSAQNVPSLMPADYNAGGQNFQIGGSAATERLKAIRMQTGTYGNNVGIFFDGSTVAGRFHISASDANAFVQGTGTSNALYLGGGSGAGTSVVRLGGNGTLSDSGSFVTVAKTYYVSGSARRLNPGTNASTDLGGLAGGTDTEQWRHIYQSGMWVGASASVASASTITPTTNTMLITGTTTINYITTNVVKSGMLIILTFAGSLTVTHNAGSVPGNTAAIYLAGAANFSATADDTLTLVYDGTVWREVARTVI